MKFASIAAGVVAALVLGATAHAASLTSGKRIEIDVNADKIKEEGAKIWERFGGWCAISEWHPAVAKCEESTEGDELFRTLTLKDGGVIKEKLVDKSDSSYKYAIIESPLPVKNYEAQFSLTPDDDDLDEVNLVWAATYDPDGKSAKEARDVIDGIFEAGTDNIKKMLGDDD